MKLKGKKAKAIYKFPDERQGQGPGTGIPGPKQSQPQPLHSFPSFLLALCERPKAARRSLGGHLASSKLKLVRKALFFASFPCGGQSNLIPGKLFCAAGEGLRGS